MTDLPIPDRTQEFVKALARQTSEGRRTWETGSAETEFVFAEEAGTVIISSIDGDGQAPFELRILDPAGAVVERYSSRDEGSDWFQVLYEAALRSTVRSSPVVENLFESIQRPKDDDIPF